MTHNQFWEQLPPVDEFDALCKREYELKMQRMYGGKGVAKELRRVRREIRRHLTPAEERAQRYGDDVESGHDAE